MLNYSFVCLAALLFTMASTFSQNPIKDYEIPKVTQGTNLVFSGSPRLSFEKANVDSAESEFGYDIDLSAQYSIWRFTPSLDYTLRGSIYAFSASDPEPIIMERNSVFNTFSARFDGAAAKYVIPKHLYVGMFTGMQLHTRTGIYPSTYLSFSPFVGTGKMTDAYVVNEASNIESILLKRGYISKAFDRSARTLLNNLLDKRNYGEYNSKFRDNAEIQFFTDAEELLLAKGIISKPLNAAATMEIYQSLTNSKYILFPVFKGYYLQAEFSYTQQIYEHDKYFDRSASLSAVYGIPLGLKTGTVISAAIVLPLSDQSEAGMGHEIYSPILLKERQSIRNNSGYIDPDIYFNSGRKCDFKSVLEFNIFHNFSTFAAIKGHLNIDAEKLKDADTRYTLNGGADLEFYILSRLSISAYADVNFSRTKSYSISTGGYISYYVF
jgi:hypothetical protein